MLFVLLFLNVYLRWRDRRKLCRLQAVEARAAHDRFGLTLLVSYAPDAQLASRSGSAVCVVMTLHNSVVSSGAHRFVAICNSQVSAEQFLPNWRVLALRFQAMHQADSLRSLNHKEPLATL